MLDHIASKINEKRSIFEFSTKANTLYLLQNQIKNGEILPLHFFTVGEWRANREKVIGEIRQLPWIKNTLVVRSSAINEDSSDASLAGCYTSVIGVKNEAELIEAINTVIASYDLDHPDHQVLLQPMLQDVICSGVAFGRDPNTNGPYIVVNYDDSSGLTDTITSGSHKSSKCFIYHKGSQHTPEGFLGKITTLIAELEELFGTDLLDTEFALTKTNKLYLFQVRPLVIRDQPTNDLKDHRDIIERISRKIALGNKRHPYLYGSRTVYGVMPDWNPAEIIGVRPRPLALSLYRNLVTDSVWAYQRDNYGYNNLRSFPLLIDFEGLPYIDVRVSFNSFLPKGVPPELAERLVNYYVNRLANAPELHDKVEFEIIFSCYTLDLKERLKILSDYGFSQEDQKILLDELTQLTNCIINNQNGLWKKDLEKIYELDRRQAQLFQSDLDPVSKMYWILEDCKRYGTLPFAGLARAGFIAVQLLKSFITTGIISQDEYADFISSLDAISSKMTEDFSGKSRDEFLQLYGHLRPGTYDILSKRYDEAPDTYFNWTQKTDSAHTKKNTKFALNISQLRAIQEHIDSENLQTNVLDLLEFIKIAIESREYSKFIFTRSVSEALKLLAEFAAQYGFSREDCSYLDANIIHTLYGSSIDPREILRQSIKLGKEQYAITKSITLPPLLSHSSDAWSFHFPDTMPNFITQKNCTGHVVFADAPKEQLKGGILFIPNADPGFDWIFSHQIAGFITQFGGVNSHMAIRAGELGIPAVIGAGETYYLHWSKAKYLRLDAENKQVTPL